MGSLILVDSENCRNIVADWIVRFKNAVLCVCSKQLSNASRNCYFQLEYLLRVLRANR